MKKQLPGTFSPMFTYVAARQNESTWYGLNDGRTDVVVLNQYVPACLVFPDGVKRPLQPLAMAVIRHEAKAMLEMPAGGLCLVMHMESVAPCIYQVICENFDTALPVSDGMCSFLDMNMQLKSYIDLMMNVYQKGMGDFAMMDALYRQFFDILCSTLTSGQLVSLLLPVLRETDANFRSRVFRNYTTGCKANHLASACGYSYNTFVAKFQREFGSTPGMWLKKRDMFEVMKVLCLDGLSLNEVADRLNMSSAQHLTRFCKTNMGYTPAELRRLAADGKNAEELLHDIAMSAKSTAESMPDEA